MMIWLKYGVLISFVFSVSLLSYLIMKTFSFGKQTLHSQASGSWKRGVLYAFGRGMMPWEKDSARRHLITYGAGLLYHAGILAALLGLFFSLFSAILPHLITLILALVMVFALLCGLGLLIKRAVLKHMRAISSPDDYVSNILVDIFLIFSILNLLELPLQRLWYFSAILLFLYIPLGKIKHCFFFFYTRFLFGSFFGRRGVYPHRTCHQLNKELK
ncbi:MAG: hypothetical protein GF421_12120 [Candidatus Aminicenantes bacterium]|nr:hypothetical protein [Candidatus Aminicenantes bacterium]